MIKREQSIAREIGEARTGAGGESEDCNTTLSGTDSSAHSDAVRQRQRQRQGWSLAVHREREQRQACGSQSTIATDGDGHGEGGAAGEKGGEIRGEGSWEMQLQTDADAEADAGADADANAEAGMSVVQVQQGLALGSGSGSGSATAPAKVVQSAVSSFSTGLDQGQAESSSTPRRSSRSSSLHKARDQPAACKRKRKSTDQEQASANSVSATGPAELTVLDRTGSGSMNDGPGAEEVDKESGTGQACGLLQPAGEGDELVAAAAAAEVGVGGGGVDPSNPSAASRYSTASQDLKCRETIFVSSSNSSNPVTENVDAEACKSTSAVDVLHRRTDALAFCKDDLAADVQGSSMLPQPQAREHGSQMHQEQRQQHPTSSKSQGDCGAFNDAGWRSSRSDHEEQAGKFPIFDTGAATKRFKAEVNVAKGLFASSAANIAVPEAKTVEQRSSSASWLQLGFASSNPVSRQQEGMEGMTTSIKHGLGQLQVLTMQDQDRLAGGPGLVGQQVQETSHFGRLGPDHASDLQQSQQQLPFPTVATVGAVSSDAIQMQARDRPGIMGMSHFHRPSPMGKNVTSTGTFSVAEHSAFSAPENRLALSTSEHHKAVGHKENGSTLEMRKPEFQSGYRIFLEESNAGKDAEFDGHSAGFRTSTAADHGHAVAAQSPASSVGGAVSLGLSMFSYSGGTMDAAQESRARDHYQHLFLESRSKSNALQKSNQMQGVHVQPNTHHMGQTRMLGPGVDLIKVPRATAAAPATGSGQSRSSWLQNGPKSASNPAGSSPTVGGMTLDQDQIQTQNQNQQQQQHGLMRLQGLDLGEQQRMIDHASIMQARPAAAAAAAAAAAGAAPSHAWQLVAMQGSQFATPANLNAYSSMISRINIPDPVGVAQSRSGSWEEASRHARIPIPQATTPDHSSVIPDISSSHLQAPKVTPKQDQGADNWQMMIKRAQSMNVVAQFQAQQTSIHHQEPSAARSNGTNVAARSLPAPPAAAAAPASLTTMQFLSNLQATESWAAVQRPAAPGSVQIASMASPSPCVSAGSAQFHVAPSHVNFAGPGGSGPWSYKFVPHSDFNHAGAHVHHPAAWHNQFQATVQQEGPDQPASSSFQHPRALANRSVAQRLAASTHAASERSSLVAKKLADRLRPADLWFFLRPAHMQLDHHQSETTKGIYMRIKDGKLPVSYVKRYLVNRLGLQSESEVEISCKGQPIASNLPLQHVRDTVWFSQTGTAVDNSTSSDRRAAERPDSFNEPLGTSSSSDMLMVLTYHRLHFSQR